MATYSLVPGRLRVATAKVFTGIIYALLSIVTSLLVAAIGYAVAVGLGNTDPTDWGLRWQVVAGGALFETIVIMIGIGLGMLFMNSPVAIVLYFILPQVFTILTQAIPKTQGFFLWLDLQQATGPLFDNSMTGETWRHLATVVLFWIVLPVALGAWRTSRREIK
jgi:hypothetical protein